MKNKSSDVLYGSLLMEFELNLNDNYVINSDCNTFNTNIDHNHKINIMHINKIRDKRETPSLNYNTLNENNDVGLFHNVKNSEGIDQSINDSNNTNEISNNNFVDNVYYNNIFYNDFSDRIIEQSGEKNNTNFPLRYSVYDAPALQPLNDSTFNGNNVSNSNDIIYKVLQPQTKGDAINKNDNVKKNKFRNAGKRALSEKIHNRNHNSNDNRIQTETKYCYGNSDSSLHDTKNELSKRFHWKGWRKLKFMISNINNLNNMLYTNNND